MNDKWLNELRDRMDGYEMDAPEGLGEEIARQTWGKRPKPFVLKPGLRRAAAAAVIFLAATGAYFYHRESQPDLSQSVYTELTLPSDRQPAASDNKPAEISTEIADAAPVRHVTVKRERPAQVLTEPETSINSTNNETEATTDKAPSETEAAAIESTPEITANKKNRSSDNRYYSNTDYRLPSSRKEKNAGKVSLAVFTSGSAASSESHSSNTGLIASTGPDNSSWHDSPMLGIMIYNRGCQTKSDIKHHLPVRSGLSVAYQLNQRTAIESGVTYTRLTSDIRDGSDNHYRSGRQTLHFIGIPVNLKYRILSIGKVDVYASAGAIAEKCVSGKVKYDYVLNNIKEQSESENLTMKQLQWTANASAGVQYNISKSVGLYAEPGVAYHFDNGSKVKTAYSDRRFDFDLNLGLRFTFGNPR